MDAAAVPPEVERAAAEAEALLAEVQRRGELGAAYEALEAAIPAFEDAGYQLEEILPAEAEASLGFWRPGARSGKGFWEVYSSAVRSRLCDPDSELRRVAKLGAQTSVTSVVTALMMTLSLPLAAAPIAASLAVILLSIGIDAFCEWSGPGSPDVA